jgi:hypothetical protein
MPPPNSHLSLSLISLSLSSSNHRLFFLLDFAEVSRILRVMGVEPGVRFVCVWGRGVMVSMVEDRPRRWLM